MTGWEGNDLDNYKPLPLIENERLDRGCLQVILGILIATVLMVVLQVGRWIV